MTIPSSLTPLITNPIFLQIQEEIIKDTIAGKRKIDDPIDLEYYKDRAQNHFYELVMKIKDNPDVLYKVAEEVYNEIREKS